MLKLQHVANYGDIAYHDFVKLSANSNIMWKNLYISLDKPFTIVCSWTFLLGTSFDLLAYRHHHDIQSLWVQRIQRSNKRKTKSLLQEKAKQSGFAESEFMMIDYICM